MDAASGMQGNSRSPGLWFAVALTILAMLLVLLMPGHPKSFVFGAFLRLPVEVPVILLALMWSPRFLSGLIRVILVASLSLLILLRVADIGSYLAFNRRFNPMVELHLIGDGWNLASQSIGLIEAGISVLLAVLIILFVCALLFRGLGLIARLRRGARTGLSVLCGGIVLLAIPVLAKQAAEERSLPLQAELLGEVKSRWLDIRKSVADLAAFNKALPNDSAIADGLPAFEALAGKDVIILFVESYGRSYIDGDGFAPAARARLETAEELISEAGLSVKSAWIDSPIRGGRSWLAHATLMSGLKIDSQARFDRLISSRRMSLNRLFGEAGWHTAGLMPAIQLAWPEGRWYGYDQTLDAKALNYKGEKFGWVTMPDQYTLAAFESGIRRTSEKPVMAEIALISSHAPWTPLPTEVLPWEMIGDGSVFGGRYREGPSTAEVWSDRNTVRRQFAASLGYMLELIVSYLVHFADDALFIILGDHQPAAIVNGWDANAHVPMHVVSKDTELLQRLPDSFFTDGMLPSASQRAQPMESIRQNLPIWFGP